MLSFPARLQTATWVVREYYAEPILDLIHPAYLGDLPPSPRSIAYKAREMGLMEDKHTWVTGVFALQ